MIGGLLKLFVVGFSYLLVSLAELAFYSDYYYAICSVAYSTCAIFSIVCAIYSKSKSLLFYSFLCVVGSIMNSLMLYDSMFYLLEGVYWDYSINYCLILEFYEYTILAQGGINVIVYIFNYYRSGCDGDDNFSARLGLY